MCIFSYKPMFYNVFFVKSAGRFFPFRGLRGCVGYYQMTNSSNPLFRVLQNVVQKFSCSEQLGFHRSEWQI